MLSERLVHPVGLCDGRVVNRVDHVLEFTDALLCVWVSLVNLGDFGEGFGNPSGLTMGVWVGVGLGAPFGDPFNFAPEFFGFRVSV